MSELHVDYQYLAGHLDYLPAHLNLELLMLHEVQRFVRGKEEDVKIVGSLITASPR